MLWTTTLPKEPGYYWMYQKKAGKELMTMLQVIDVGFPVPVYYCFQTAYSSDDMNRVYAGAQYRKADKPLKPVE